MKKLLVDKNNNDNIKVKVKDVFFGGKEKVIISGPCSVESPDIMIDIARNLKLLGVHILRGGAFKPRTSPYDFQGLQYEGLKILKEVGMEVNLPVVTEVMDARDLDEVIKYADMLQIGSRNMYNYTLLREVGKSGMPVLLKRGLSATINEWVNAAEYIMMEGNFNVVLCERGIRTFENYTRNTLDLNSVAVVKQKYRIPVIVDPSHGTGRRELVAAMSFAAVAAGADGLIIESHVNPDNSISDATQTVSIDSVKDIICKIKKLETILQN
ncbi:3-deoxy-7-phosphoheptulonate synthase [Clostridium sp. P21]|uniref:3-deoxy-7-phosphoheptulonate synthase n=1 Tax=Clostridium muellerianum TaxID=2716538 RepID=A0A7Y0EE18_9CLOT|nr:3-deoxy-7-phosphoheptulonate synthase [Clostridium muellerianum]NMM61407.1 3-deoxy-7-phosphoheptulonate synthase [Clostridium muellerianum]